MKGATWNIRGLNKRGKLQCITDFINDNKLDFVSFQETKKESFDDSFLSYANKDFAWHCLPAIGTVGGILVGLNSRKFEALAWQNIDTKFVWRFISVSR
jgi:exonuclease III